PGTEAWLLLQGSSDAGSGLIGHGTVMSEAFQLHERGWFVMVVFDALLPIGGQVPLDALRAAVPAVPWREAARRASTDLAPSAEPGLRRLWREQGPTSAGREELVSGTFPPEAVSRIDVNRYERNADARRLCLAYHGTSCAACGYSFERAYGEAGTDVMDVHHVVPPEMLGSGYQLDPVTDLLPLCPNCHAMAHRGPGAPTSVPELRRMMAASGHLRGEVLSDLAVEAQEDARRILEAGRD
ncbi:MAG: restriction endonuclease, partial [Pseudarthrobacter sp.]|nr:restriction endonuclease [Pseudarthrobacter sp.]